MLIAVDIYPAGMIALVDEGADNSLCDEVVDKRRIIMTEIIHFFAAQYDDSLRENSGGGIDDEDIEVVELPFTEAVAMMKDGRIKDAKTIMLLQYAQIQGWFSQS